MHKTIILTITNDPDYDQRMQRICTTLSDAGFKVILAGRKMRQPSGYIANYKVKRMHCLFHKGPLQYAEYHFRLFFWLLFQKGNILCAVDIDTILPVYAISCMKRIKRVFDAHEYFSELKEVVTRPKVQKWWKTIENFAIPRFTIGYTVGGEIARVFREKYGVDYAVIRNVPLIKPMKATNIRKFQAIIYQGAINEARGMEYLIPAMKNIDAELHFYGTGNFLEQSLNLTRALGLTDKIKFFGMVSPQYLQEISSTYTIGINLVEHVGLNQYYSLANKFFDYIHAGIPQVTMNFPEYAAINQKAQVAVLLDELSVEGIASAVNLLLHDSVLYCSLVKNCLELREIYNWEIERIRLLEIYEKLL
ncbi:glycosyltransferase [Flavihumibacter profundi]|jgi:glycosyltransferase involved in cell wall biosynthesis|uniref:glycosyltransferase n=1 Tax=Flavihumibacter profundi TaxID=2716883 RepID=UPI001CC67223|nr:glycosyltransferase [Flavihumibacter profundi]MBZ5856299.1 glycosyltransferase [Flavihumibacter profundi]